MNVKLVNNTCVDVSAFDSKLLAAVDAGELPHELHDVFTLTILNGFNEDGSNRGVLNWA